MYRDKCTYAVQYYIYPLNQNLPSEVTFSWYKQLKTLPIAAQQQQ